MKKLPLLALLLVVLAACKLDPVDDRWESYKEWREDSEAWLKAMTDSTNESDLYLRNRVRREVLPVFKSMNPSVLEAFFRMTEAVRAGQYAAEALAVLLGGHVE